MLTNNNDNDDERTPNLPNKNHDFAVARNSILTGAAIGIIALVLTFSGITSSIPMAAAQTLQEENGMQEQNQTTAVFFTNNNETGRLSILGALGISVVEGVKITAIALNEDASEVTVTVSSAAANETNATTAGTTPGVTAAAFKTQLDLAGLLQAHTMMEKSQGEMPYTDTNEGGAQGDMMMAEPGQTGMMTSSGMPMFDVMSLIESLEIGSDIEQEGWTSPAEVTVPVISGDTADATANITTSAGTSDTEIVIVMVIPYTGETETAATTSAGEEEVPVSPFNQEGKNQ